MTRDLEVMSDIQKQKDIDIKGKDLIPLDAEGVTLAEHKRYTFDIIDLPTDPLR